MNEIVFNDPQTSLLSPGQEEATRKLATMAASCDHEECTQWSLIDRNASW